MTIKGMPGIYFASLAPQMIIFWVFCSCHILNQADDGAPMFSKRNIKCTFEL